MSKTITLRISDEKYHTFRSFAEKDNRPISNFIETAVERYIESNLYADEFEMSEIKNNPELNKSIKNAFSDVKAKKGKIVE